MLLVPMCTCWLATAEAAVRVVALGAALEAVKEEAPAEATGEAMVVEVMVVEVMVAETAGEGLENSSHNIVHGSVRPGFQRWAR